MRTIINKFANMCRQGFDFMLTSNERGPADMSSPLSLVQAYENACLDVYDGMCTQDRVAMAFAFETYMDAAAAIANLPDPDQRQLRELIADRDVVPPSVEVAVDALAQDVGSVPEPVLASAMRAQFGDAAKYPVSVRRIVCALTLMDMAATRRASAKSTPAVPQRSKQKPAAA